MRPKKTCSVTTGCGCEYPLRKLAFQKVEAETFYGSTNLGCPQVGKQHNGRFNFLAVLQPSFRYTNPNERNLKLLTDF